MRHSKAQAARLCAGRRLGRPVRRSGGSRGKPQIRGPHDADRPYGLRPAARYRQRTEDRRYRRGRHRLLPGAAPSGDYREGKKDWQELADGLSRIGAAFKKAGKGFGYHNHHWEFVDLANGKMPIDLILASPDVQWEFDLAWEVKAGKDPLALMDKYGSAIVAVHVKDIAPAGEKADEDGWADVGTGTLDWQALLGRGKGQDPRHLFRHGTRQAERCDPLRPHLHQLSQAVGLKMAKTYGVGIMGAGNISTAYMQAGAALQGPRGPRHRGHRAGAPPRRAARNSASRR